jgi:hypothetical protein
VNHSQLSAAFHAVREYARPVDVATNETLDLSNMNFAFLQSDSTGNKTIKLPNAGFVLVINNFAGAGTLSVVDSDGSGVASIADDESAICVRVGEETSNRWHAVVLKLNAT